MLDQLLNDFGYLALFIGTFLEGETILVLAGVAAAHKYLDIEMVILVAFIGSYFGDQLWYFIGRRYGISLLQKRPKWQKSTDKALLYLRRNPDLWVLTFRFMYGLRTIMPIAIGISNYPPKRYMLLNAIGAVIWSIVLGCTAYYLGKKVLDYLKDYELYFLGLLCLIVIAVWLIHFVKNCKNTRHGNS